MLKQCLFRMAQRPFAGRLVGMIFQYASWALPVRKVYSSKEIVAFCHPQPCYEHHMIVTPKRAVADLLVFATEPCCKYATKLWEAVWDISRKSPIDQGSFVLVANGGSRQKIPQVHFHLFTDHPIVTDDSPQEQMAKILYADDTLRVLLHPAPDQEKHFVFIPASPLRVTKDVERGSVYFRSVLRLTAALVEEYKLVENGYSLVYQHSPWNAELPVFHLISGGKRAK